MKVFCIYFLFFFLYSFFGWILEVSCKLISDKKFINRGFLIGPYCPIYGCGAVAITLLLQKYFDDPFTLFIMTMLVCSVLEYSTSYVLEKIFQTRWWDYSKKKFHINGRICLETMVPFGLFGLFLMYVSNPFFYSWIQKLSETFLIVFSFFLFLIILIDSYVSFRIMSSLKLISSDIRTDSTEKVTKMVRKEVMKQNKILQKRLIEAFPKLEVLYSKGIERKQKRMEKRKRIRKGLYIK